MSGEIRTLLSPLQQQVLAALVSGSSISAAAHATGVHRSTIHIWSRSHVEFRAALAHARQTTAELVQDSLGELTTAAVTTLRDILQNEAHAPSVRLRAALAVIGAASKPLPLDIEKAEPEPAVSAQSAEPTQVPRNASCPCGSGVKYKRCCGTRAPAVLHSTAIRHTSTQFDTSVKSGTLVAA